MKYIFVTGGVVSSLGKGLTAASLGTLLENRGLKVALQKFDPYLNVDPGTMNPYQHGEVYVLDDGAETDLDLGHYERFTNVKLTRLNNLTSGQVYQTVLNNEREGKYLGKTVQVIPHVTDEIKNRIHLLAEKSKADVIITEIGGTTGDIEGLPFLEAIREFALEAAIQRLDRYHLLILDDLVYVTKDQAETSVLFELISARYERRSVLITANQPFGEWGKIFQDPAMTLAAVDRLVHHATIFEMNVESYRRRAALARKKHGAGRPAHYATTKNVGSLTPSDNQTET